jgi:hypothetical protein
LHLISLIKGNRADEKIYINFIYSIIK